MNILHLISQHPESTGSGYYLQNIIKEADEANHRNYLVCGISGNNRPELSCIEEKRCEFVSFESGELDFKIPGMSDIMPYPSTRFMDLSAGQLERYYKVFGRHIKRAVESCKPDIIHSHHLWFVSSIARQMFSDIPMVTSCHSTDLRQFVNCGHLREKVLDQCRRIDRILSLTASQKQDIIDIYGIAEEKIDIVGGGFDKQLFRSATKDTPPPINLLYAGKLNFSKGVDMLLETFTELDPDRLHLHIAGSGAGPEAAHCLQLAEQQQNITLHGRLNQHELADLMGKSHIFILPSLFEGLPLVLLEALSCRCRIIATSLPGCRELLEGSGKDVVEFIRLDEMVTDSTLDSAEKNRLKAELKDAILKMTARVERANNPDVAKVRQITQPYHWDKVFERINRSYQKAISG